MYKSILFTLVAALALAACGGIGGPAPTPTLASPGPSQQISLPGTAVIYLAGRSGIAIPKLEGEMGDYPIGRCANQVLETMPAGFGVPGGSRLTFGASGGLNFYGDKESLTWGPDGDPAGGLSGVNAMDGVGGYTGPAGALVGVFLTDQSPVGAAAPAPLDFAGAAASFGELRPAVGQVFLIGDGRTAGGEPQLFIAPIEATRLYLGYADAAIFFGWPGCYDDNYGSLTVIIEATQPLRPLE